MRFRVAALGLQGLLLAACARSPGSPAPRPDEGGASLDPDSPLPPVPSVDGPLALRVVYPPAGSLVTAVDSSFLFGSLGSGQATLTINGAPVEVWPNGTWLAWVELPPDSVLRFALEARREDQVVHLVHEVRRVPRFAPGTARVWIDSTSLTPRGEVWWPAAEPLPLRVRAREGARLRLILPDGRAVPLHPLDAPVELPEGIRAFDRDPSRLAGPAPPRDRFVGALVGTAVGSDLGPPLGGVTRPDTASPVLEAVLGRDTARVRWPLRVTLLQSLPQVVTLDDDPLRTGLTDGVTVGRALPGGTYHWFFPAGTQAAVRGRINADLRLGLSAAADAWVAAAEAVPLPMGIAPERAVVGSITSTAIGPDRVQVRIPLSHRAPFRIDESEREVLLRFYRAAADPNWIRYGATGGVLQRVEWSQATSDEVELRFTLDRSLWGYRSRWQGGDLLLELRGKPEFDRGNPARGRLIVVDPGHPPGGATGPGGLSEAVANLAIAFRLRDLLQEAGARVVLTRSDTAAVDLWPRVRLADSLDAELLVSIHNNALPDGLHPFRNSGSSVFYFHPRSVALAREVQRQLVARLGVGDLGIARGDLALVRGTWMPAILTEGLFMMIPSHEAALRTPAGQEAYARAVSDGIVLFLATQAGRGAP